MKQPFLIPIIFLSACSTTRHPRTVLHATPVGHPVSSDGLRTEDQLKDYEVGRYVDARDPLVMHEGHPVYRVETSARWDLRPNARFASKRSDIIKTESISANDAVVAEVNKQRAATQAFTDQTATLNQRLNELGQAVEQTKAIAEENLTLKRDVASLRQQLDAVEAKLPVQKPAPSPSPNDTW